MAYRRRRGARAKKGVQKYVKKAINSIKRRVRNKNASRKVNRTLNMVGNKVPFTYFFTNKSTHNHKNHHKHHAGTPCMDNVTVLISKGESSWIKKMGRLFMTKHFSENRLPKGEYFMYLKGVESLLVFHHAYNHYLLNKNYDVLAGTGLDEHKKSESELQRKEAEEDKRLEAGMRKDASALVSLELGA